MVVGLDVFKTYFEQFPDNYIIIGGSACDRIIGEAGFIPRATKDIDLILVVEALSSQFVRQFWTFIQDGQYSDKERSAGQRQFYRFRKPANHDFPFQVELFSRIPDVIVLPEKAFLTPIPVDEGLSSLSAILLEDEYYNFILRHSELEDGLRHAKIEALICLKVIAYLEIRERIVKGSNEDSKQLKKHKSDIFRLTVLLPPETVFELPEKIQDHLNQFAALIQSELPDKAIFKEMGLGTLETGRVYEQLIKSFKIKR